MKGLTVIFFLFTAFAIVLAHGIIPHHHHEADHDHDHEHSHPLHEHHHPAPENHADHHNMYTWFIHGKKELSYSPAQLACTAFSVTTNNCQISLPDAVIKKVNLPPELNIDFMDTDHCNIHLLRAPPLFLG